MQRTGPSRSVPARLRPVPERSEDFAHLSLEGLRTYRRALGAEEGRVSYWRRIIQARLDLVRAAGSAPVASVEHLRGVFAQSRVGSGRQALVTLEGEDDLPPLPDLAGLWDREPVPGADLHNDALAHDLVKAEAQLSAYRSALHQRLSGATGELIARYREEPLQCLSALPLLPARERRAAGA